jgi:hypothetical protein
MSKFAKPFFRQAVGLRPQAREYPYPAAMFDAHDTFEMFPLDGGACFHTIEQVGSTSGMDWLSDLECGCLLAPWTVDGEFSWDRAYDDMVGGLFWPPLEKHVWLNRLYFLLPIAHAFLCTKDEGWARTWYRYLRSWSAAHPYTRQIDYAATKFVWRDMQVTWRLIVLMHSAFMLGGSKSLNKAAWSFIYRLIRQHAEHVHWEAAPDLAENKGRWNHFLQKGAALIYAGVLFPEFPEAAQWLKTGRGVVKQQLDTEINADGGSIEACPSYSHFIARLHLDSWLLLDRNGLPQIPGLTAKLRKQYEFLGQTASPLGRTLQLGDSYSMNTDADIALVREVFPLTPKPRGRSVAFKETGMAVLRNRRIDAYVDAMPLGLWHIHDGKPNVLAYVDGEPLLVDSGACSYDAAWHHNWYKTAAAHNAVVVSPVDGPLAAQTPPVPSVRMTRFTPKSARFEHVLKAKGLSYTWTREVRLGDRSLTVVDRVTASRPVKARQMWHFPAITVRLPKERGNRQAAIRVGQATVVLRQLGRASGRAAPSPFAVEYHPAVDADNRISNSPQISSEATGRDITFRVQFRIV